jgi:hypothetical protein
VGLGPRWCVHPGTDSNVRGGGVCSYSPYDQPSGRLDLACYVLPVPSDDLMVSGPGWDDCLSNLGHDSLASFCAFALQIRGNVAETRHGYGGLSSSCGSTERIDATRTGIIYMSYLSKSHSL